MNGANPQHCTRKYEPVVRTLGTESTETMTSALVFAGSEGTTAVMAVSDQEITAAAGVPWNLSVLEGDCVARNRAPVIVTTVPGRPEAGETLYTAGAFVTVKRIPLVVVLALTSPVVT